MGSTSRVTVTEDRIRKLENKTIEFAQSTQRGNRLEKVIYGAKDLTFI